MLLARCRWRRGDWLKAVGALSLARWQTGEINAGLVGDGENVVGVDEAVVGEPPCPAQVRITHRGRDGRWSRESVSQSHYARARLRLMARMVPCSHLLLIRANWKARSALPFDVGRLAVQQA